MLPQRTQENVGVTPSISPLTTEIVRVVQFVGFPVDCFCHPHAYETVEISDETILLLTVLSILTHGAAIWTLPVP